LNLLLSNLSENNKQSLFNGITWYITGSKILYKIVMPLQRTLLKSGNKPCYTIFFQKDNFSILKWDDFIVLEKYKY